jgi:hypothetical protein
MEGVTICEGPLVVVESSALWLENVTVQKETTGLKQAETHNARRDRPIAHSRAPELAPPATSILAGFTVYTISTGAPPPSGTPIFLAAEDRTTYYMTGIS